MLSRIDQKVGYTVVCSSMAAIVYYSTPVQEEIVRIVCIDTFLITFMFIDIHMGDVGSECSGSVSAAVTTAVGSTKSSADRETSS